MLNERGVDFIDAVAIFDGGLLVERDERRIHGEERYIAIGETQGDHFVVV